MKKMIILLAVSGMVLALAPAAQAGTIYSDDFSGSAGNLNGTSPDVKPGSETWTSSTAWQLSGSGAAAIASGGRENAWLAFTPTTGNEYTLSADVDVASGGWLALGFSRDGSTTQYIGDDGYAWALRKAGVTGAVQTFNGLGTANGSFSSTAAGSELKVVLDTVPTLWTVEYFVGGTSLGAAKAYTTNPDINYVGFARESGNGTVANFSLTDNYFPPAGTVLMIK